MKQIGKLLLIYLMKLKIMVLKDLFSHQLVVTMEKWMTVLVMLMKIQN